MQTIYGWVLMNKYFLLSLLFILSLTLTYQLFQNKVPTIKIPLACGNTSSKEELLELKIHNAKLESKVSLLTTQVHYRRIILNLSAIIITLIAYGFAMRKDFLLKKEAEIQALQTQINQQKELMNLKDEAILYMYENNSK